MAWCCATKLPETPVILIYEGEGAYKFCVDQLENTYRKYLPAADIKRFSSVSDLQVPLNRKNIRLLAFPGGNEFDMRDGISKSWLAEPISKYAMKGGSLWGSCAGGALLSGQFFGHMGDNVILDTKTTTFQHPFQVTTVAPLNRFSDKTPYLCRETPEIDWCLSNGKMLKLPIWHCMGPAFYLNENSPKDQALSVADYSGLKRIWSVEGKKPLETLQSTVSAVVFFQRKYKGHVGRSVLMGVHSYFNPDDLATRFETDSPQADHAEQSYNYMLIKRLKARKDDADTCTVDLLKRLELPVVEPVSKSAPVKDTDEKKA